MQLLLVLPFLFTFAGSSSVDSDLLSSVDTVAFWYSHHASQRLDCPQVRDREKKAEEARVWQTGIPDARIEETVIASGNVVFWKAEQYAWIERGAPIYKLLLVKSDPFVQKDIASTKEGAILLGMREPNVAGDGNAPLKVLYSKHRQVNQSALARMLSQLEQVKDKILAWMARKRAHPPVPALTAQPFDALVDGHIKVPRAANYHPRVFRHAHFTTGDLVAWLALTMELRQRFWKDVDPFPYFDYLLRAILPSSGIDLGAVSDSGVGGSTKAVYLPRPFQYVPAGADIIFSFDGNRGRFQRLSEDSIVLACPEGIVNAQRQSVLLLHFGTDASAFDFRRKEHKNEFYRALRETLFAMLEQKSVSLGIPNGATCDEAQAVSRIRSLAAGLQGNSFLEAHRRLLEAERNCPKRRRKSLYTHKARQLSQHQS